ncbi:MAG: PqqD family protein [Deltaproteobacteria bacterium]|nr:PqqD family protein [Deltaproteobacteria bacterium]
MRDEERIKVPADVLSRILDGEAVLLDLRDGAYYGLNEPGSRIWELLATGMTVGELRARMLAEFDVDEATLRRDLEELLGELTRRGLVDLQG